MNTTSPLHLAAALALALSLAACGDRGGADTSTPEPSSAPAAPAASPSPPPAPMAPTPASLTDQWLGQWNGPEGTFVRITGGSGHYDVTIQNLDGPRTFVGRAVGKRIEFERDGQLEKLQASDGAGTGMKWLAEKKDCLKVRTGEGYCRD